MGDIRVPQLQDVRAALKTYYERYDLRTQDIVELFGCSHQKAKQLKDAAQDVQREEGLMFRNASMVDTETAFRAWGIDIESLERRVKKLEKIG